MTVLRLSAVSKAFAEGGGQHVVLDGVDLDVEHGEIVALVGRSGSGKTTLLTLAAGLEAPDAGTVIVLDGALPPEARPWSDVAILPQSLGLLGELTALENITLPSRLSGAPPPPTEALLERLGIDHLAGRFPNEVSLGEQQRIALARAVVGGPSLLLADEPISHQNHAWAAVMMELVSDLAAAGTSCLLATHNDAAFAATDRVLELGGGHLRPAG